MMTFKTLMPILVLALVAGAAHSDALPEARPVMLRPAAETLPVVDRVLVRKAERRLLLMQGGNVLRSYHVALGLSPVGQKERSGDFRTPEGSYRLARRNPRSDYFLSIKVSYPNPEDLTAAGPRRWDGRGPVVLPCLPN